MIVETELQAVARCVAATASATASARGRCAKAVVDTYVQIVAVAGGGSHIVEVLISARQVRQRNIGQQSQRYRVDLRNRVAGRIAGERLVRRGIENLYRHRVGSRSVGLGKVTLPLQQRGHGRKLIERIFPLLAVEVDEVKSLGAAMVDMRNVERSADGAAEAILQVRRFFGGLAGYRKRRGI